MASMKFIVSSSNLLKHLSLISGVIPSKSVLPILENFLFEIKTGVLRITATDLEISMVTSLPVEAQKDGRIAVPHKVIIETLRSLPEQPVTFSFNEENFAIEINSDNGKYKMPGENGDDYPKLPAIDKSAKTEISAGVMSRAISKTLFAASSDDLRPALTGVYCELTGKGANFVATDAHMLSLYTCKDVKSAKENSFIVPGKAFKLLKGMLPSEDATDTVKIEYNSSNAHFDCGNTKLICRLIEEKYPDYQSVIPHDNPNTLQINKNEFLHAVNRMQIYSDAATHQIRIKLAGAEMVLSAENPDHSNEGREVIACDYDGDDLEIGFNANFLAEILKNVDTEKAVIKLSTPNRAGVILPETQNENEDILMLVMPVMLHQYAK